MQQKHKLGSKQTGKSPNSFNRGAFFCIRTHQLARLLLKGSYLQSRLSSGPRGGEGTEPPRTRSAAGCSGRAPDHRGCQHQWHQSRKQLRSRKAPGLDHSTGCGNQSRRSPSFSTIYVRKRSSAITIFSNFLAKASRAATLSPAQPITQA